MVATYWTSKKNVSRSNTDWNKHFIQRNFEFKKYHQSFWTWLAKLDQQSAHVLLVHKSTEEILKKKLRHAIETLEEKSFGAEANKKLQNLIETWKIHHWKNQKINRVLFLSNMFVSNPMQHWIHVEVTLASCTHSFNWQKSDQIS